MRLSSFLLLLIAGILGVGAAFLAQNWLEGQRGAPAQVVTVTDKTNMRRVVVAGQALRFGNELTAINLKEIDWPAGAVPEGAFTSLSELTKEGQRRVVLTAIERDEPVLRWKITGPGQRASLSAVIDSDKKAVTIRVNDVSGTAGFVLPGDRVDVLLTRSDKENAYTDVLLQGVRALAIDQVADDRTDKPSVAKAVTLEVSTADAQKLNLAATVGTLSLMLRPAGAAASAHTARIGVPDLISAPKQASSVVSVVRAVERKDYEVRPERHDFGD